ncbi:MAG: PQQ-dependent sugar dehydrogenase, partial [Actinomycetota bacterium]|nr:PQQ-dependent sugar dehydrogenase [Actinomycetota bacterium]
FSPARRITVPAGFRAELYARGLTHPTAMAYGPDGRLYVTEDVGRVVVSAPRTRGPRVFASGFDVPLGLAWFRHTLFVSEQGGVERVRLRAGRAVARRTVLAGLPYGLHQQDNVVVGPDGRLYLGSGSTCNACVERDRRSAAVLSLRRDGSGLRVVARGLRNPFGLAFEPETGRLYASVNGRDDLPTPASPEPAETLVRVERGAHYGWPRCWASARLRRLVGSCRGVTPPVAYLEAHSSADGLAFSTGSTFPAAYRDGVFVALWGQYRSREHGRRVDFVRLRRDGTSPPDGVSTFARGFEHPLALAVDPDGALLVADYGRGVIYRIQARGAR